RSSPKAHQPQPTRCRSRPPSSTATARRPTRAAALAVEGSCAPEPRSTQRRGDAAGLIGSRHVEGGFPDGDLAGAQHPDFDTESAHRRAGVGILPLAAPGVADGVAHQRAKLLVEPVALLLRTARGEEGPQRLAAAKFRYVAKAHDA